MGNQFIKDKVKSINIVVPEPVEDEVFEELDVEDIDDDEELPEEGIIGELFEE